MAIWNRTKGSVKRTPQQEAALRVRILDQQHAQDVIDRVKAELGTRRAAGMGPVDLSRNALCSYVERRGRAYLVPPAVTGLGEALARAIGDATATTTIEKYAAIPARPMPSVMVAASQDALRYRLGANFCGVAVGWSDREERPTLEVVSPDDLEITYASDNPLTPTVIRWRRSLDDHEVYDVSDLTDLDNPVYRIEKGGEDITGDVLGHELSGDAYWWRYEDGRPFHRVIVSGDPRHPYRNLHLVEGTMRLCAGYTGWWAGMRDAGYPSRHALGLDLDGAGSITGEGEGVESGPEYVQSWQHRNPDKPGTILQLGPGYDPEIIGRALRTYELGLLSASGLPVDWEGTGGEPSARDAEALDESIQATYPDCRGQDVLLLRRLASVCNRAGEAAEAEGRPRPYAPIPERGYGVLYRGEIEFPAAKPAAPEVTDAAAEDAGRGPGEDRGDGEEPEEGADSAA